VSQKFLVPIQLPADPVNALEAVTKQYVDARAGSEVEININDPIGTNPNAELWFDSDATTVAMTDDMRWYTSWGIIATGTFTFGDGVGWTSGADITNVINLATVNGRKYRAILVIRAISCTNNATPQFQIFKDGVSQTDRYVNILGSNGYANAHLQYVFDGDGASHAFKWVLGTATIAGLTGWSSGGHWYIEDMGPVTGSSITPTVVITPWTNATLVNAWTNAASPMGPLQYRKVGEVVQLRGTVHDNATTAAVMTTLPVGFRPPYEMNVATMGYSSGSNTWGVFALNMPTSGIVQRHGSTPSGLTYINFDVQFSVAL